MRQVISTREMEARRQPFLHVQPPVDLLKENQVGRPAQQNAGRDSEVKKSFQGKKQNSIAREQSNHIQGSTAEVNVLGLFGAADGAMVLQMTTSKNAAGLMQQPAVIGILEGVAPDQSHDEA